MDVNLPVIVVLGALAWSAVKFFGIPWWAVLVIALTGFWLSDTVLAPGIESGTRTGVDIVNDTNQ